MLSNFVELIPNPRLLVASEIACQQVKVGFQWTRQGKDALKTTPVMLLYIGMEICHKLCLKAGDKVKFFIDKENPKIWQIKKASDDCGYTLFNPNPNQPGSRYLKLQITWSVFKPEPSAMRLQVVSHEFYEGGLLIQSS